MALEQLSSQEQEIIRDEETTLASTVESLRAQIIRNKELIARESSRARELTTEFVSTHRAEDKALLASDESVSHSLLGRKHEETKGLTATIKRPYFAHLILDEETERGLKRMEYKIGYTGNLDARIIDWRTAPLSKLYYEYREGEEYSEVIQGKERLGTVARRVRVDINNGTLRKIASSAGTFVKNGDDWSKSSGGSGRDFARSYSQLPPILSLITAEQFRLITRDSQNAVLIQGIAGSGKTTVALHRLAWLLFERKVPADQVLILVHSPLLKSYLENSLSIIDLEGVQVLTLQEWLLKAIPSSLGISTEDLASTRSLEDSSSQSLQTPRSISRLKQSKGLSAVFDKVIRERIRLEERNTGPSILISLASFWETLLESLNRAAEILAADDSRLISENLIKEGYKHVKGRLNPNGASLGTSESLSRSILDRDDLALLARYVQLTSQLADKQVVAPSSAANLERKKVNFPHYEHIVVDEVQDWSLPELLVAVSSVRSTQDLTLVGDVDQGLSDVFPGWKRLIELLKLPSSEAHYVQLQVSYRCTKQIAQLSQSISGKPVTADGREGRAPIWFRCSNEEQGVGVAIEWIQKALQRYPQTVTAVLTRNAAESRYLLKLLTPTFGNSVRLLGNDAHSLEEGIAISTIADVKGIEFCNVVLWNVSHHNFSQEPEERNLLYVGASRAEENLCLISFSHPSSFLPPVESGLTRCIRMTVEQQS